MVFSKLIVGYDGSSHSDKALSLAVEIAKKFNSKITLVQLKKLRSLVSSLTQG